MERPRWTYDGKLDCFGISPQKRDGIIRYAINEIHQAGGELQIRRLPNRYDTDRYRLRCHIPGDPRCFKLLLKNLAVLMPEDHPRQEIQGFDQINMQREDLIIQSGKVWRQPWQWQPSAALLVR